MTDSKRIPTEERYWAKVDKRGPDECWPWTARLYTTGYGQFWDGTYRQSGGPHSVGAHRWAYLHFIGPLAGGEVVMHRCDNPPCQNPRHLTAGTHSDNAADRQRKGRGGPGGPPSPGVENGAAKLNDAQVIEIRALYAAGYGSQAVIAREFGVSQGLISAIVNRRLWRHL